VALLVVPQPGRAGAFDVALEPGLQHFEWKEYDAAGRTVVKESGTRPMIAIRGVSHTAFATDLTFAGAAQLYLGDVDYKGQTTTGVPLRTSTGYFGAIGDALFTKPVARFPVTGRLSFQAGARLELWRRKIAAGVTAGGQTASGLTEEYRVLSGRAGLGGERWFGSRKASANAGVSYPLSITEWVSGFDRALELHPGREAAAFARLTVVVRPADRHRGSVTALLSYDSYRWGRSPLRQASVAGLPVTVYQPRSHMDVVAASLWFWM